MKLTAWPRRRAYARRTTVHLVSNDLPPGKVRTMEDMSPAEVKAIMKRYGLGPRRLKT